MARFNLITGKQQKESCRNSELGRLSQHFVRQEVEVTRATLEQSRRHFKAATSRKVVPDSSIRTARGKRSRRWTLDTVSILSATKQAQPSPSSVSHLSTERAAQILGCSRRTKTSSIAKLATLAPNAGRSRGGVGGVLNAK